MCYKERETTTKKFVYPKTACEQFFKFFIYFFMSNNCDRALFYPEYFRFHYLMQTMRKLSKTSYSYLLVEGSLI